MASVSAADAAVLTPLASGLARLPAHGAIWVAYSGGRDSTALLDALYRLAPERLHAIHIHHGLQDAADAWAAHCAAFAGERGIPFRLQRVTVTRTDAGPESDARQARYAACEAVLAPQDILVTAHHADDQAETVLFRLLRGGGVGGAAGMSAWRALGGPQGPWLWRPLLAVPRDALSSYCHHRALAYVDDPSNTDGDNARARLRALLPELETLVPGCRDALREHARQMADQQSLLTVTIGPDLSRRLRDGRLDVRGLLAWSRPRRHALLRAYLAALGVALPGARWLDRCDGELLGAARDAQPQLLLDGHSVVRHDHALLLLPTLNPVPEGWQQTWQGGVLALPGQAGQLETPPVAGPPLEVRFVTAGERVRFSPKARTQRLKHVFQRARVPPWERERTPVVSAQGRIVQVGDWPVEEEGGSAVNRSIRWRRGPWHRRPGDGSWGSEGGRSGAPTC